MHANDLFATITAQLIDDIETGAAGTWCMPWHHLADAGTPTSIDQRPYRGMNALWLAMVAAAHGWTSGTFGTYRAWQRHGAQVRRGVRATQVVLWKPANPTDTNTDDTDDGTTGRPRLIARAYAVFAAEQCDGADEIIARRNQQRTERDTPKRIDDAEQYLTAVAATVIEGGNRAYYRPTADTIHVPTLAQFVTAAHYYATRAHETIHWTGHTSRLDRELTGRFGDDAYAAEELVAELGAAMWCAQTGLSSVTRTDHAAYLAGWLRILRSDARALITVASRAQAAVDWLNTHTGHATATADEAEEVAA
jgi:antirestriction protein ArdC